MCARSEVAVRKLRVTGVGPWQMARIAMMPQVDRRQIQMQLQLKRGVRQDNIHSPEVVLEELTTIQAG